MVYILCLLNKKSINKHGADVILQG